MNSKLVGYIVKDMESGRYVGAVSGILGAHTQAEHWTNRI